MRGRKKGGMLGIPEVVHVGDLLHTQPAELTGADGAVHAVAAAVVGLHDVCAAARTRLDLLCIFSKAQWEFLTHAQRLTRLFVEWRK